MSSVASGASSAAASERTRKDAAWEHALPITDEFRTKNRVGCKYCLNFFNGGITRFKKHLAGIRKDCTPCTQVPDHVKEQMIAVIAEKEKKKDKSLNKMLELRQEVREMYDQSGNEGSSDCAIVYSALPKKPRTKGPMDKYRARPGVAKQTTVNAHYKVKEVKITYDYICDFFIEGALAHNIASLKSFARMVEAIGQFGPGLKPPTPYQLANPLLKIQVSKVDEMLKVQKEAWAATGCSIMTDAWTDRRGRSLMNLVAHSSRGVCFLRAIEASLEVHDAKFIFSLVMTCISEIGAEKVVQVVTDNASNNLAAAKLLKQKHPHIFWTSCAAHTINLMLQDIGNIPVVSSTITNARWWTVHGTSAKDLKKMAIRILSLTCSSSACERNWSAFERVHSKKRTRLGQKKLNDLVYVMFNKRLDSKYSERERDPLVAKYIEDAPPNEWMLDEELLQDDEASEDEAEVANNLKRKQKSVASRTRGKRACTTTDVEEEDEEEEAVEEEEMEEEEENQEAKEDSDGEDQEVDIDLTLEDEEDGE